MIVGSCTNDENPDYWFPELPQRRASAAQIEKIVSQTQYALDKCDTCPVKLQCRKEGMKEENLPYGIWGGMLPAERLYFTGYKRGSRYVSNEKERPFLLQDYVQDWIWW